MPPILGGEWDLKSGHMVTQQKDDFNCQKHQIPISFGEIKWSSHFEQGGDRNDEKFNVTLPIIIKSKNDDDHKDEDDNKKGR